MAFAACLRQLRDFMPFFKHVIFVPEVRNNEVTKTSILKKQFLTNFFKSIVTKKIQSTLNMYTSEIYRSEKQEAFTPTPPPPHTHLHQKLQVSIRSRNLHRGKRFALPDKFDFLWARRANRQPSYLSPLSLVYSYTEVAEVFHLTRAPTGGGGYPPPPRRVFVDN